MDNDYSSCSLGDQPIFGVNVRFLTNKGSVGDIDIYTDKIKTDKDLSVKQSIAEAESLKLSL